jgi:hypothetical protein
MNTGPVYLPRIRVERGDEGRLSWRFTGRTMGFSLLVLLLASLVGSFYLSQASHTATAGLEVVGLAEQRERLRQENAELRTHIAELEAVSNIRRRAQELGFTEAEKTEYLVVDSPPPATPDREQEPLAQAPAEAGELGKAGSSPSGLGDWWADLMSGLASWMSAKP